MTNRVGEWAAAAVSVMAAAGALGTSAQWPIAMMIVAVVTLAACLGLAVRRELRRQDADIQAIRAAHSNCTENLSKAQVAIVRLHALLSSDRRRADLPPLNELLS